MDHSSSNSVTFFRAISKYAIVIFELMTEFIKTMFEYFGRSVAFVRAVCRVKLTAAGWIWRSEQQRKWCGMEHCTDWHTIVIFQPQILQLWKQLMCRSLKKKIRFIIYSLLLCFTMEYCTHQHAGLLQWIPTSKIGLSTNVELDTLLPFATKHLLLWFYGLLA